MRAPDRVRRTLACVVAGVTVLAGVAGLSAPAQAATGAISGVITADDTGQPIASACVTAYDTNDDWVASQCTDDAGHYELADLPTGVPYKLVVYAPAGYLSEWAQNSTDFNTATDYLAPTTVDVGLATGVKVSGTIRDTSGAPVPDVYLTFEQPNLYTDLPFTAGTDADGRYLLYVKPGTYTVFFNASDGRNWYAFRHYERSKADAITVHAGTPVTVDDTEPLPNRLTGTITDAQTGSPLAGICVSGIQPGDPGSGFGSACTGSDGRYTLDLPTGGTWFAEATDPSGVHAYADSRPIRLADEQTVTGVDLRLSRAGTLTGKVVDRITGAPIEGICPSAYAGRTGDYLPGQVATCSDSTGTWTDAGLPAGPVTVHVSGDATHLERWAADAPNQRRASVYQVVPDSTATAGTVRLYRGGSLTGRITDTSGRPVAGAWVLYGGNFADRAGAGEGRYSAQTNADGRYTITNIEPSERPAEVYTENTYAWQWSGQASDPTRAKPIEIRYNRTSHFDAVLQPQATLAVTVTGTGDHPDRWLMLDAFTASGAPIGWGGDANADGTVTLRGFPTSRIRLRITIPSTLPNGDPGPSTVLWYDGATSQAAATPIPVRSGQQTRISVTLPPGS